MSAGGASGRASGITAHAAIGSLEIDLQPFAVPNPVRAERFTALTALLGPRIRLGTSGFARPAVGLQYRRWSGANPVTPHDQGLALGLTVGLESRRTPGWHFSPQLTWRSSIIEFQGSVATSAIGLRVDLARWR